MPSHKQPTSNHLTTAEIKALFFFCAVCNTPPEEGMSCGFSCTAYLGRNLSCTRDETDTNGYIGDLYIQVECDDCGTLFVDRSLTEAIQAESVPRKAKADVRA